MHMKIEIDYKEAHGGLKYFQDENGEKYIVDPYNGKHMALLLDRFVNNMLPDKEGFIMQILLMHRTLQQNLIRLFVETIIKIGEQENYDLRNEDAVLFGREIKELAPQFRFI